MLLTFVWVISIYARGKTKILLSSPPIAIYVSLAYISRLKITDEVMEGGHDGRNHAAS